jgi:DNA-binding MarR family transcriptional regulator
MSTREDDPRDRLRAVAGEPPADDREALIWTLTGEFRAYQRATDAFDELGVKLLGVNRTDGRCLDLLNEHGRMTAGELAAQAQLTTGAITGVLDRLERAGHVRRTRDETDRRRVLVETTPAFDAWAEAVYGPLGDKGRAALRRFGDDELGRFIEFIRLAREITEERAAELREEPPPAA